MKKIFLTLLILLMTVCAYADTHYISPTGDDGTGDGTTGNPWQTLRKAYGSISSGDTLILKDGTYSGADNTTWGLGGDYDPPYGTSGAYTIIKAENDGAAIIDGQGTTNMVNVSYGSSTNVYWQFEGLLFANGHDGCPGMENCNYMKFFRCGAYDVSSTGNYYNFSFHSCDYVLLEGCYSYGSGRYKFNMHSCDHCIYRNCVGRMDTLNAGGEPAAIFGVYSCNYFEVQNCIAIDSDQDSGWICGDRQGSFFVPCTDAPASYVNFTNCIGLNVRLGGIQTAANYDSSYVVFSNCVLWGCGTNTYRWGQIDGTYNTVINCTIGCGLTKDRMWNWQGGNGILKNTIVYNLYSHDYFAYGPDYGHLMYYPPTTQDYNNFYANSSDYDTTEVHKHIVNPLYDGSSNPTGALKYITQCESGSNLSGHGESGADIGANVKTLIGTSGAMWGETGYATDTELCMWPFPNQNLIRSKMAAYTAPGIDGDRGFCANGETLTHYIMNYLGNGDPYTVDTTAPASVTNLSAQIGSNSGEVALSWTAPGDDGVDGTATSYDVRYSTSTINEGNWTISTAVTGEPTPSVAGSTETLTISNLSPGTTYYFAMKTTDEQSNTSDISNSSQAQAATVPPQFRGISWTGIAINL